MALVLSQGPIFVGLQRRPPRALHQLRFLQCHTYLPTYLIQQHGGRFVQVIGSGRILVPRRGTSLPSSLVLWVQVVYLSFQQGSWLVHSDTSLAYDSGISVALALLVADQVYVDPHSNLPCFLTTSPTICGWHPETCAISL